ncbi:MAG: LysR family transcriptional regulator, partial [Alkalimonas sp.]|nr:LysR family transcriptional regulator [Alkalimonas sp.]
IQHADILTDTAKVRVRTNSAGIALTVLLHEGGAAYLPESMVQQHLESGCLQLISDAPVINRNLYGAYLKSTESRESLQAVLQQLIKV